MNIQTLYLGKSNFVFEKMLYKPLLKLKDKKIGISLSDLSDKAIYVHLDEKFRKNLFREVRNKLPRKSWRSVCKFLYGRSSCSYRMMEIERGERPISMKSLKKLSKISFSLESIEKYVTSVRMGEIGKEIKIKFPLEMSLRSCGHYGVEKDLIEYKIRNLTMKENLKRTKLSDIFYKENSYLNFNVKKFLKNERFYKATSETTDYIVLKYSGKGKREIRLSTKICIDEQFAKCFGNWIGDKSGGKATVGLGIQEIEILNEFSDFLRKIILNEKITLEINYFYKKSLRERENNIDKFKVDLIRKYKINNRKYGSYSVCVHSRLVRRIFDFLEGVWFEILLNSPKTVVLSFLSGFYEAEGSIERGKYPSISFGSSKKNNFLSLFLECLSFQLLIKNLGYNCSYGKSLDHTKKICYNIKIDNRLLHDFQKYLSENSKKNKEISDLLNNKVCLKDFHNVYLFYIKNCCGATVENLCKDFRKHKTTILRNLKLLRLRNLTKKEKDQHIITESGKKYLSDNMEKIEFIFKRIKRHGQYENIFNKNMKGIVKCLKFL